MFDLFAPQAGVHRVPPANTEARTERRDARVEPRAVTRQSGAAPLDLVLAELGGCVKGPFAWLRSRRTRPGVATP